MPVSIERLVRRRCRRQSGCVAQLVEQLTLNQRVTGSIPVAPTTLSNKIKYLPQAPRAFSASSVSVSALCPQNYTASTVEVRRLARRDPERIPICFVEENSFWGFVRIVTAENQTKHLIMTVAVLARSAKSVIGRSGRPALPRRLSICSYFLALSFRI
jgi:hypothetical protein